MRARSGTRPPTGWRWGIGVALALTMLAANAPMSRSLALDGGSYVSLANARRASVGLRSVMLAAAVDQIAVERAAHMARQDLFVHDMTYVARRLSQLGVCTRGVGEIIAWERGYASYDPARTVASWWASPGHHAVIVGDYDAAGGSWARSIGGTTYAVMILVKLCQPPAASVPRIGIRRLAGGDRYATAAAISSAAFSPGVPVVYVANGSGFADALSGSAAAAVRRAPVLLVQASRLPAPTAQELARLRPRRIIVLGAQGAVADRVLRALRAYAPSVSRVGAADRYATSAAVSAATFDPNVPVAYVATGETFPDALAGGAAAGREGGPVLLVRHDRVPSAITTELARLRPQRIVVLGSTAAISARVAHQLARSTASISRRAGADRYATAVAVSAAGYRSGSPVEVFVSTGADFPDGLAAGPLAALVPGPLLLVRPSALPSSVAAELRRLSPRRVVVLGSSGAVSDGVVRAIRSALP
ncbi:MAG: cell wall-binding repeat-containing protein [Candidatus Limnocylindria bacterium]